MLIAKKSLLKNYKISVQFNLDLFSTIKTIQDKKFNNTIVTYVTTMKVMAKTITTIVTKNGQI